MLGLRHNGHASQVALEFEPVQVSVTELCGLSRSASAALDGHAVPSAAPRRAGALTVVAHAGVCLSVLGRTLR